MTAEIREWLPRQVFSAASMRTVLGSAVASWSSHWFLRHTASISSDVSMADGGVIAPPETGNAACIKGRLVEAMLTGRGRRILLEAALALDVSAQPQTECDSELLDLLSARVIEDLVKRLDEALPDKETSSAGSQIHIAIAIGRSDVAVVRFPSATIIPALKSQWKKGPRNQKLRSVGDAIKTHKVSVGALLGHVDVALNELKELTPGDILIMDKGLNEPVDLRLSGSAQRIGRGKLGRNGDRVSVQL